MLMRIWFIVVAVMVLIGCGVSVDSEMSGDEWSVEETTERATENHESTGEDPTETEPRSAMTCDEEDKSCFTTLSAGPGHICALDASGHITCFGNDDHGKTDAPSGSYVDVSAGSRHSCAVDGDGEVDCWGIDDETPIFYQGQTDPPDRIFSSVSSGSLVACGIEADDRSANCWGNDGQIWHGVPGDVEFAALDLLGDGACGLDVDGGAHCWGLDQEEGRTEPPDETFTAVSTGAHHACGINESDQIVCWGAEPAAVYCDGPGCPHYEPTDVGQVDAPDGEFIDVTTGANHSCGLDVDGEIHCWGTDEDGITDAPGGEYVELEAGARYTCAVARQGTIDCWGRDIAGLPAN